MRLTTLLALLALFGNAGCAPAPIAADQLIAPVELGQLVSGKTLYVPPAGRWPYATMLYLDPGGHGWLDDRYTPGEWPRPGDIRAVISWQALDGSQICIWSSARIGEMPFWIPPSRDCFQVYRLADHLDEFGAVITRYEEDTRTPLDLADGNRFPPAQIEQYLLQVRVLFGGQMPFPVAPSDPGLARVNGNRL